MRPEFVFLDSRTSRLQVFPKPKCRNRKPPHIPHILGSHLLNATLIQAFTDIESVCERYWVWILNIKSTIKLKLWTLHSKDSVQHYMMLNLRIESYFDVFHRDIKDYTCTKVTLKQYFLVYIWIIIFKFPSSYPQLLVSVNLLIKESPDGSDMSIFSVLINSSHRHLWLVMF